VRGAGWFVLCPGVGERHRFHLAAEHEAHAHSVAAGATESED
jgi:hypothetical protein